MNIFYDLSSLHKHKENGTYPAIWKNKTTRHNPIPYKTCIDLTTSMYIQSHLMSIIITIFLNSLHWSICTCMFFLLHMVVMGEVWTLPTAQCLHTSARCEHTGQWANMCCHIFSHLLPEVWWHLCHVLLCLQVFTPTPGVTSNTWEGALLGDRAPGDPRGPPPRGLPGVAGRPSPGAENPYK